jgi:site-specific DNA-methyltransferase (adenine-specific)
MIVVARKPLSEHTVAANVLRWGTGALNIAACRVEAGDKTPARVGQYGGSTIGPNGHSGIRNGSADSLGRWPANCIHDGSDEVLAAFPEAPGQQRSTGPEFDRKAEIYGKFAGVSAHEPRGDSGSAARFYYSAKADSFDRAGSKHPTVKPVDLIQYLCRLITPPGGIVLDPFAGTGTTGEAAFREGFRAVLIEREVEYQEDIRRRIRLVTAGPVERLHETIRAKQKDKPIDLGPLFAGLNMV